MHMHGIIEKNHNYTIQIKLFWEDVQIIHEISLHFFLNHTFLKYVMIYHIIIINIYIYIYIYDLEFTGHKN